MNTIETIRAEYKGLKKGYYHLSSDGWKEGSLFHTSAQYAYGMVLMGLLTLRFDIVIYNFCLMPNHFHIILSGTGDSILSAFVYFRQKLSARLVKDGYAALPEDYVFKLTPIDNKEQMKVNYLYVDRNPYEREYAIPGGYPWGMAYQRFSSLPHYIHGQRAGEMSKRELERLTGSRAPIPPGWEFHPELGLLPKSFVDNTLFQKLFPSPKEYLTRLVKDYESFVKLGKSMQDDICFSLMEIKDILKLLINEHYPGKWLNTLSHDEKGRLCVLLSVHYNLSSGQIADALVMPEHLVRQFLLAKDYGNQRR